MINTRSINVILALSLAAMIWFSLPLAWHFRQPLEALVSPTTVQASQSVAR